MKAGLRSCTHADGTPQFARFQSFASSRVIFSSGFWSNLVPTVLSHSTLGRRLFLILFERRTSTGSGLFALLGRCFVCPLNYWQNVFIRKRHQAIQIWFREDLTYVALKRLSAVACVQALPWSWGVGEGRGEGLQVTPPFSPRRQSARERFLAGYCAVTPRKKPEKGPIHIISPF